MKTIQVASIIVVLLLLQVAVLYAMGQPLICHCGQVKWFDTAVRGAENSQHLFDWYTLFHLASGMTIYLILRLLFKNRLSFATLLLLALALSVGWEIFENTYYIADRYHHTTVYSNYFGDSIINSLMDTVVIGLGFALAWHLPWPATVFIIIGLEILTGIAIRDSAILNAIMLIHPFPAILSWQGGG